MPTFQFHGVSLESILLAGSGLLVISVLVSRISSKFGVPILLLFLGIGMLVGSEGPGRIAFDNYPLSFAIGSICLAFIVFDGGLRTSWKSVKPILPLGISLSFFGTIITGVTTAIFSHLILGLSWIEGSLLGAIVSSTDAAAVFGILRARSLLLKSKLKQTLEFEAGSNDPVAVFLTVSVLMFASTPEMGLGSILLFFAVQACLGFSFGWLGGKVIRWLINHVGIEFEGLYSVLLMGLVMLLFGVTSHSGGSGFLAVYVAGVVLGNSELLHKGSITKFLDGVAWIAQILVFITLGLLVYPSHLLSVWKEGILLGLFMMIVARPLSVLIAAPGNRFSRNEKYFVSWVGLRGAAPVILATLPWSIEFPKAEYIFNLVFFVVLISVISQGISIPWMATLFKVIRPLDKEVENQITENLLPAGFQITKIIIQMNAEADGKRVVDINLPSGVLLTSVKRGDHFLIPKGDSILKSGDEVSALARPSNLESLKKIFGIETFSNQKS